MHDELNMIHRDLKPENMMVCDYKDLSKVKIVDFGLAAYCSSGELLDYERCGTLIYMPPEQINHIFAYVKVSTIDCLLCVVS